jgi:hypothetical protein
MHGGGNRTIRKGMVSEHMKVGHEGQKAFRPIAEDALK